MVFLGVSGMKPPAVAVPVLLVTLSLLFAAASAAVFARAARLYLENPDPGEDDDGGGPGGGGPADTPQPPNGSDLGVDWEQFEADFRSYCEQVTATR